jgi:membrane protein
MATAEIRNRLYSRLSAERARAELERLNRLTERGPLRTIRLSIEGFQLNNDFLWASALTYTSSLSLVPILAVALSAVKGFGGVDRLRPVIEHYLAADSPQITDELFEFVGNLNARALGEVGGAALLATVVLTLGTIEQALNTILKAERGRTWVRKFSDYLSVTFAVPLMVVAAVALKTSLARQLPDLPGLGWLVSTIPMWGAFSFLYLFFPNTRVSLQAALIGGFVAAVLLQLGQWGYVRFQIGAARYQAIYGALAAVPILLTWIYMAWVIVLYGAELTAAAQSTAPALAISQDAPNFERIAALLTALRAGQRMAARDAPLCTAKSLAAEMGVAEVALHPVLGRLADAGVIVESSTPGAALHGIFLARDSSTIPLTEVLAALEAPRSDGEANSPVASLIDGLGAAERAALGTLTVKDLVKGDFGATSPRTEDGLRTAGGNS